MQNAPKKICLVGISLAFGGAERSMAMLSQMLTDKGYKVYSVVLSDAVDFDYDGELLNLGIHKLAKDTFFTRFSRLKQLRNYLVTNRIDCVIDHRPKNQYFRELFYNLFVYKSIPKIDVVHSSKQKNYLEASKGSLAKIFKNNVATVAVSKHIEQAILKPAGIKKTYTIYNAYNPQWQQNLVHLPKPLTSQNYILFYGRIDDKVKDIKFLMKAFAQSELWKQKIYLVILGEGVDLDSLKELASKMNASAQILFFPFTEHPFSFVKNAKFVTLTSRYEGFPMVLVESLSLETPVVSLDIVSGPSEIVVNKENGLLVKRRDEVAFANAMIEMFKNEQLYHNCKLNAKNSVIKFNMNTIAQQWNTLLKNVI